ncbi:MAG: sulfatase-like hydrolase/transferase [Myxococcota bacterium]
MTRGVAAVALGCLLACSGYVSRVEPTAPELPPNVLVVVLDDVGRDRVRAFGGLGPPTPTLDALAAEGVKFPHTWSMPVCSPTRASILTGRYPHHTGIGRIVDSWKDEPELAEAEITLPEMLGRSRWTWDSSMVGKWHLGSRRSGPPETHPGRQGFRWWAGTLGNLRDSYGDGKSAEWGYFRWMKNTNGQVAEASGYVTTDTADDAIDRIGAMTEPWLLYVAFNAAHFPTHVPPDELHSFDRLKESSDDADKYDAALEAVDQELGRVLAAMSPELRARTYVFVVGDNGTPDFAVRPPDDPERAKGSVYELGVGVPLVVTGPGVRRGARSDALVSTADLFATVAEIAAVEPSALGVPIDGVSFLTSTRNPSLAGERRALFTEKLRSGDGDGEGREQQAVSDGRYTLIVDRRKGGQVESLYDGERDPRQSRDLLERSRGLDPEAQAAYDALAAELTRLRSD